MMSYDLKAHGPYQHTWWINDVSGQWEKTVFFPAATTGMDTNTTIDVRVAPSLKAFCDILFFMYCVNVALLSIHGFIYLSVCLMCTGNGRKIAPLVNLLNLQQLCVAIVQTFTY